MSGISLLDQNMREIPLDISQLSAAPRDMNSIPGHSGDYRTLEKLINGVNLTTDDANMWLIPLTLVPNPSLTIDLRKSTQVGAIKIWNYNKSLEDSFRGVKKIRISIDDKICSPSGCYIVRKAPGNTTFDFGHVIHLAGSAANDSSIAASESNSSVMNEKIQEAILKAKNLRVETPRQDYETPLLPSGCELPKPKAKIKKTISTSKNQKPK